MCGPCLAAAAGGTGVGAPVAAATLGGYFIYKNLSKEKKVSKKNKSKKNKVTKKRKFTKKNKSKRKKLSKKRKSKRR